MKLGKFLFGAAVGAIAGLLLAPKKGSELREDLVEKSKETYVKVKNLTREDVEAILGETIENVKKTVDEFDSDAFKDSTKVKLNDLQAKLETLASQVKESEQYAKVAEGVSQVAERLNAKIEEAKNQLGETGILPDSDAIENEIDNVENELDEMIDEIKD
ncbi:YtxH domain-containing protein [uncultured Sharpea sp.]|uniref:YtxH domain-containing protein n=1 Tax=uncultured Sharpea sp. TaxID=1112738 RepID=UPI00156A6A80|nr:YtxH domain-containing protein [uncultured Sharpea sp.]